MERLAEMIMFGRIKTAKELDEYIKDKFKFKKGKEFKDIKAGLNKALTGESAGKVEWEIQAFVKELKKILNEFK